MYFWGFFILHVGGQIPRDLFEEIVARTFVGSFGLILSQICHGFGLDLEFFPKTEFFVGFRLTPKFVMDA